jgi:hypothetical protein
MTFHYPLLRAAIWLAASVAALAHGAEPQAAPNPLDAGAAVPATRYAAALPYRPAPAPATPADQNWKAQNRTVAGYDSMALTMERGNAPALADSSAADGGHAHASHHAAPAAPAHMRHSHGGGQ